MPGPEDERPDVDDREQAYGLGRLVALSDGVFAFALTPLVVRRSAAPKCRYDDRFGDFDL